MRLSHCTQSQSISDKDAHCTGCRQAVRSKCVDSGNRLMLSSVLISLFKLLGSSQSDPIPAAVDFTGNSLPGPEQNDNPAEPQEIRFSPSFPEPSPQFRDGREGEIYTDYNLSNYQPSVSEQNLHFDLSSLMSQNPGDLITEAYLETLISNEGQQPCTASGLEFGGYNSHSLIEANQAQSTISESTNSSSTNREVPRPSIDKPKCSRWRQSSELGDSIPALECSPHVGEHL